MKTLAAGLLLALTAAGVMSAQNETTQAGAAGRGGGPGPRNLQVLPKDTPPQDVVALMQQITRALGVQCTYCHVEMTPPLLSAEEAAAQAAAAPPAAGRGRGRGRGGPQMDYAADEKRQKLTARLMLTLTNDINAKIAALPAAPGVRKAASGLVRVQCATCHRGVTNPQLLPDLLVQTMTGKGEAAAIALYRDLRQRYFGTEAYDFRESVLLDLGRQSLASRKPDDALAWLQLNIEFYPNFAESYLVLSQVHVSKRDPAAALKDVEKALALDPSNAPAKRELAELQKRRDIQ